MTSFNNLPIRSKLTVVIMTTSTLALLFSLVGLFAYDLVSVKQSMTHSLTSLAHILGSNTTAAIEFNEPHDAEQTLAGLSSQPNVIGARIYDRDGTPFASYVRVPHAEEFAGPEPHVSPTLLPPHPMADGHRYANGTLAIAEPVMLKGERVGTIYIAADTADVQALVRQYFYITALVLAASMIVALLVSNVLQKVVSRPIQHLASVAEGVVREQNYAIRATKTGDDETGLLIDAFNQMLTQIQTQDADLRNANETLERRVDDRTKQLRASQASLEANLALVEATLEATTDAILVVDRLRQLTHYNQNFVDLWHLSEDTLKEHDLDKILAHMSADTEQPDVFMATVGRLAASPEERSFDVLALKDGRTIERYSQPQRSGGHTVGRVWSFRDVTERMRVEQEIRKARDAAEAAARAKSEFLANMSHEIRTPMNGIIGMTELALDTKLTGEQREFLNMVKSSADSLLSVINDILDFSKIEAGKMDLDEIDFSLRDCVSDAMRSLALRADAKDLELATSVQPDVPDSLFGDPHRLRQVLINLAGNAIKFTEKGEIVVTVERAPKDEAMDDSGLTLLFSVKDTGPGIPEDRQKVIFDAFMQADNSTTRKFGGTGLGLTISGKLVSMLGGRLWVESRLGEGSTFHFTAHFAAASNAVAHQSDEPHDVAGMPVLVVDDNATNRRILEEMLHNWHMNPTCVPDGETALAAMERAAAENRPFSLLLVDGNMPNMDGFQVAEEVRQRGDLVGAAIMMLSSAGQTGAMARCRKLGIREYLIKPIKQSELLDAIMRTIGGGVTSRQTPIPRHEPITGSSQRPLSILVTEDNVVNQRLAVRLLEKRGHTVTVASNGIEALEKLRDARYDIVLMDVQMPEMDGYETTAAIREYEGPLGRHTPIVAMTAHAMTGDREKCLEAGMDGYVSKPLNVDELLRAIDLVVPPPTLASK